MPALTAAAVIDQVELEHGPGWSVYDLAPIYEALQSKADRDKGGVWYTPQGVPEAMSRLSLEVALSRQVGPSPDDVLRIVAFDPACGCGQFMVAAALHLAREFAARLIGGEPDETLVGAVLPVVVTECVFGQDIDPTAAELARIVISRLTSGALTSADLAGNITAGDTLNGDEPPALRQRMSRR